MTFRVSYHSLLAEIGSYLRPVRPADFYWQGLDTFSSHHLADKHKHMVFRCAANGCHH